MDTIIKDIIISGVKGDQDLTNEDMTAPIQAIIAYDSDDLPTGYDLYYE